MPKKTSRTTTKKSKKQATAVKKTKQKVELKFHTRLRNTLQTYLRRRPHRSFVLTRRRDYVRSLDLPGYWSFTREVWRMIWSHRRLFAGAILIYTVLISVFVGLSSQQAYGQLSGLLQDSGKELFGGGWGELGKSGLLLAAGVMGSFAPRLSDVQQVYNLIFLLLTWLTTVWLLRAILAGNTPRLRDAIYNSGAPLVSTALVLLALFVQFIPAAIATIVLNAALSTEFIEAGGLLAMMLTLVCALLIILSMYWATSTFMALVVVTLPGMYPWQAIRTAGDLVVGRRLRIVLRLMWLIFCVAAIWVAIIIPTFIFDSWLKNMLPGLEAVPLVPIVIAVVNSFVTVCAVTYVYLLYRKVVEDDADPA